MSRPMFIYKCGESVVSNRCSLVPLTNYLSWVFAVITIIMYIPEIIASPEHTAPEFNIHYAGPVLGNQL